MEKRNLYLKGVSEWTWVEGEEGVTMLAKMSNGDIERRHFYTLQDVYEVTGKFPVSNKTSYVVGYRKLVEGLLKTPIHDH